MLSVQKIISYLFILFISLPSFSQSVWAQTDQQSGNENAVQISLVPGLSTSDSHSSSQFSLNIIGGYNGRFHGVELGSVFNGNRYDISGLQMSGAVNYNQQQVRGLLFAGALNISQTFSGGASFAGAANVTKNHTKGLMVAGGVNVIHNTKGLNLAPINIAQNQMGTQIGVLNTAKKQEGTQIGVLNIVRKNNGGTPIGLLSIVKNGRFDIDIWGNETGFINGGMRFGTKEVYNIVSIGYNPFCGNDLWQVGLGIGYHYSFNHKGEGLETDLVNYHLNHGAKWTTKASNHIQWRMHRIRTFTKSVRIFFGPSVNLLISDQKLPASQVPYTVYTHSSGSNQLRWWIGWSLGFELF